MKYVNCPVCGHKLLEGKEHSCVRVKCSKCKTIVEVSIGENNVALTPLAAVYPTTPPRVGGTKENTKKEIQCIKN